MNSLASRVGGMLLALSSAAASAAGTTSLIASESFSYAGGISLTGLNGGAGWTSAWASDSPAFPDFATNATGLTYPGLATTGGRMDWQNGGSQLNDAVRTLPLSNSGVIFLQFLAQFGTQSGGGTPNFRLSNGSTMTGAIGNNGACGSPVYAILDNTLNPAAGGTSCSNASLSALSLVLVQIDYDHTTTKMWVNPNLATFDYLNPPTPQAQAVGLAPAFDRIAIYSRSPASIDELRVMRVVAPTMTPQPVSSLSLAALLLLSLMLFTWASVQRLQRERVS